MLTRVANLVFAIGAALFAAFALARGLAVSAVTLRSEVAVFIAACWFVSAIALFFRARFAWYGSIIGAAALVCFLLAFLVSTIADIIHPGADIPHDGAFRAGYIFACIFCPTMICVEIATVGLLIFGLFKTHKDLV